MIEVCLQRPTTSSPKAHYDKGDNSKETALQSTAHHFQYAFEHILPSVSKKDQARYDRLRDRMAHTRTTGGAGSTAGGGKGDTSDVESPLPPQEGSVNK